MRYIMEHLSDIKMLDMLGGHIEANERERYLSHIENCADCRKHWHDLRQVWGALGALENDICSIDLIPAVTTGINHRRSNFFLYARKLSKIAASILLAAFIGYGAGRISMSKSPEKLSLVVAETSYLVCLAPGSSTGLAESE